MTTPVYYNHKRDVYDAWMLLVDKLSFLMWTDGARSDKIRDMRDFALEAARDAADQLYTAAALADRENAS